MSRSKAASSTTGTPHYSYSPSHYPTTTVITGAERVLRKRIQDPSSPSSSQPSLRRPSYRLHHGYHQHHTHQKQPQSPTSSFGHRHTKMSSPSSLSSSPASSYPYHLVTNMYVPDAVEPETAEIDLDLAAAQGGGWVMATVIEDDDLTFGGKPLSAWYEEERHRQSAGGNASYAGSSAASSTDPADGEYTDEEELRGRQRVRSSYKIAVAKKKSHRKQ